MLNFIHSDKKPPICLDPTSLYGYDSEGIAGDIIVSCQLYDEATSRGYYFDLRKAKEDSLIPIYIITDLSQPRTMQENFLGRITGYFCSLFELLNFLKTANLVAHSCLYDLKAWKMNFGESLNIKYDTYILESLIPQEDLYAKKSLQACAYKYVDPLYDKKRYGQYTDFDWTKTPKHEQILYAVRDAYATYWIYKEMKNRGLPKCPEFNHTIELEVLKPIIAMEMKGLKLDTETLREKIKLLEDQHNQSILETFEGKNINISSSKALGKYLFEDMGLPPKVFTKSGAYSTSEDALTKVDHPIVQKILDLKKSSQLINKFHALPYSSRMIGYYKSAEGIKSYKFFNEDTDTDKIQYIYKKLLTQKSPKFTGNTLEFIEQFNDLTCSKLDPDHLQLVVEAIPSEEPRPPEVFKALLDFIFGSVSYNVAYPSYRPISDRNNNRIYTEDPAISSWNWDIRESVLPSKEGNLFYYADVKSAEFLLLAYCSGEMDLVEKYTMGFDIHKYIGSMVFQKSEDEVTSKEREICKQVCYAIIYGSKGSSIEQATGIPLYEAKSIIDTFMHQFPNIASYIEKLTSDCLIDGSIKNPFGKERRLDLAGNVKPSEALNTYFQTGFATIFKLSLIHLYKALMFKDKERGVRVSDCSLVTTCHDSYLIEIPEINHQSKKELLDAVLIEGLTLNFKGKPKFSFKIDSGVGSTWSEAKKNSERKI